MSNIRPKPNNKPIAVAEKADRPALSRIAVHHDEDGYSWRDNFGGSSVHSMF